MFYDRFIELCKQRGEKPTPLLKSLGLSPGNLARWQNGASVNSEILEKIAVHFSVSVDSLLGIEKSKIDNVTQQLLDEVRSLSDEDLKKVIEYAELLKLKSNDKSKNC